MADDDTVPPAPKTAVVAKRPPAVERAVELAAAERAQLLHDLDEARAENERIRLTAKDENDSIMQLVTQARDHINKLQAENVDLKSRATIYQIERDEAVTKHAKLEGFFTAMLAQFRAYEIPITPIMRERVAEDAESTMPALDYSAPKPPTPDEMLQRINGQ